MAARKKKAIKKKAALPVPILPSGKHLRSRAKTSKERIARSKRARKIMELRLAEYSVTEIAQKMGVSRQRIQTIIREELARYNDERAETVKEYVAVTMSQCKKMMKSVLPKAFKGDYAAQAAVHRTMERMAKLNGADWVDREKGGGSGGGNLTLNFEEVIVKVGTNGKEADPVTRSAGQLPAQ